MNPDLEAAIRELVPDATDAEIQTALKAEWPPHLKDPGIMRSSVVSGAALRIRRARRLEDT